MCSLPALLNRHFIRPQFSENPLGSHDFSQIYVVVCTYVTVQYIPTYIITIPFRAPYVLDIVPVLHSVLYHFYHLHKSFLPGEWIISSAALEYPTGSVHFLIFSRKVMAFIQGTLALGTIFNLLFFGLPHFSPRYQPKNSYKQVLYILYPNQKVDG